MGPAGMVKLGKEQVERDVAVQLFVAREVDLPHSAEAEELYDVVWNLKVRR